MIFVSFANPAHQNLALTVVPTLRGGLGFTRCRSSVPVGPWLLSGPLERQLLWMESRVRLPLEVVYVSDCPT